MSHDRAFVKGGLILITFPDQIFRTCSLIGTGHLHWENWKQIINWHVITPIRLLVENRLCLYISTDSQLADFWMSKLMLLILSFRAEGRGYAICKCISCQRLWNTYEPFPYWKFSAPVHETRDALEILNFHPGLPHVLFVLPGTAMVTAPNFTTLVY